MNKRTQRKVQVKENRMNFLSSFFFFLFRSQSFCFSCSGFYDATNISTTSPPSPSDCCCFCCFINLFLSSIIFLLASSLALAASETFEGADVEAELLLRPFLAFFEVAGVTFRARGCGATPLDFGFGSGAWKGNRKII